MQIVYAILAIVVLMIFSSAFDSIIRSAMVDATNPLVKIVLLGLDALLGIPTDIISIFIRIAFYLGILLVNFM